MRLVEAPLNTADTAITVTGDLVEVGLWKIETAHVTARAGVNNLGRVLVAVLASDGDIGSAKRVCVGVGSVVGAHDLVRDSDDLLVFSAGETARSHTNGVVSEVAGVSLA